MTKNIFAELRGLSTTYFCDLNPSIRIIPPEIYAMTANKCMLGSAFTVAADDDLFPVMQAINFAEKGDVIVISSTKNNCALIGEILVTLAARKGICGILVDGYCRDYNAINKLNFPLFARGCYPLAGTRSKIGALNLPIIFAGVAINHNDIIFGDDSGIIILDKDECLDLLPDAHKIHRREQKIFAEINAGKTLADLLNYAEHHSNLQQDLPSKLRWLGD